VYMDSLLYGSHCIHICEPPEVIPIISYNSVEPAKIAGTAPHHEGCEVGSIFENIGEAQQFIDVRGHLGPAKHKRKKTKLIEPGL